MKDILEDEQLEEIVEVLVSGVSILEEFVEGETRPFELLPFR